MHRKLQRDLHHQDALSQGQRSKLQEEQTSDSHLLSVLLCIAFSLSRTDRLRNVLAFVLTKFLRWSHSAATIFTVLVHVVASSARGSRKLTPCWPASSAFAQSDTRFKWTRKSDGVSRQCHAGWELPPARASCQSSLILVDYFPDFWDSSSNGHVMVSCSSTFASSLLRNHSRSHELRWNIDDFAIDLLFHVHHRGYRAY